jgi:hypothetical protein
VLAPKENGDGTEVEKDKIRVLVTEHWQAGFVLVTQVGNTPLELLVEGQEIGMKLDNSSNPK